MISDQQTNAAQQISAAISRDALIKYIDCLHPYQIIEKNQYCVFLVPAADVRPLIQELGRLREFTFRKVGEGTGNAVDVDAYDDHYIQLFIWDKVKQRIVGGYRLGGGNKILPSLGIEGFYLSSLFDISEEARPLFRNALELGRSFIIPDYQKMHLPLLLLWKGILHYLVQNPWCKYLIGPVSISKYYSTVSKSVIVAYIKKFCFDEELATYFKPRKAFEAQLKGIDIERAFSQPNSEMADLEDFLNTIEPGHIKVPILLKQYAKQNAKFIGFNLDPNFSDALDGLMILDIANLPSSTLKMLSR